MTPLHELVEVYIRHYRQRREDDFWAWEEVTDLVSHQPEVAWEIVTTLIERAESPTELAYFAAGPLEDLIKKHGAQFVDRIEVQSRRSAQFRQALGGVWGWNSLPRELRERFKRIPGLEPVAATRPPRSRSKKRPR